MEPLHKQIRIRRAHRSVATKLEREAIQLLSEAEETGGDDRISRLETITELLNSKLKELKVFDGLIIDLLEDEEKIDSDVAEANEYEFRICNAIRRVKRKLHPPSPVTPTTSTRIRRQLPTTPPSARVPSPVTPLNPSSEEQNGNGNISVTCWVLSNSFIVITVLYVVCLSHLFVDCVLKSLVCRYSCSCSCCVREVLCCVVSEHSFRSMC